MVEEEPHEEDRERCRPAPWFGEVLEDREIAWAGQRSDNDKGSEGRGEKAERDRWSEGQPSCEPAQLGAIALDEIRVDLPCRLGDGLHRLLEAGLDPEVEGDRGLESDCALQLFERAADHTLLEFVEALASVALDDVAHGAQLLGRQERLLGGEHV